jgi:hypothetical protein
MVLANDSAQLSTRQMHLLAVTTREDGVSYINSARLSTVQIHLLAITDRDEGVSYQFRWTLYNTDSLTRYNSEGRWCQLSIQLGSPQHRFTYFL